MTVPVENSVRESRGRPRRKFLLGCAALGALAFAIGMIPRSHAAGILSEGTSATLAPVTSSVTSMLASQQQANLVAAQAQNQLTRVTNALQAMQALQTAARNLAIAAPSSVPDGLQTGGLVPDSGLAASGVANPVKTWVGAQTPTQSSASGKTTVNINQTAAEALLSWNSFNVGKNTTVNFNQQGNATWTALNKVTAGTAPSQILGSITAPGHVYVINPNGIIFGGASQINVGSLVASSADLSSSQYFANGIFSPETGTGPAATYTPSFTDAQGPIIVEPGAEITTSVPADVTTGGGIVLMLGTQVVNGGTITTAEGQTELAAGDSFRIRPGLGTSSNLTSTTRGNEVAVVLDHDGTSLIGGSGLVTNTGMISAATGDITLAGETVEQDGVALSSTSVVTRGTIHLLSSAGDPYSSVTLGSGAYTLIEPERDSTDTELDNQRTALIADSTTANEDRAGQANLEFDDLSALDDQQEDSRIEIVTGGSVHFAAGSDSSAPGGQLAVSAVQRIQADDGALLDVSGSYAVPVAMSSNEISFKIENNELRDDPQNRLTGDLLNASVNVDTGMLSLVPASAADSSARDYTEGGLLEVSGYVNADVTHTIGEYTAIGGAIDLSTGADGAIVAQSGSTFNINGGSLQYTGGDLAQSYLVGSNGRLYNVNTAPADITYTGVFGGFTVDHANWGVEETYGNVLSAPAEVYQAGYTVGRAAGTLTLSSATTLFNGTIDASTVNGAMQTAADPAGVTDPNLYTQTEIAEPGTLNIYTAQDGAISAADTDVVFDTADTGDSTGIGDTISPSLAGGTYLNAGSIDKSGLGGVDVITDGSIGVTSPLTLAPGAQVSLYGSSIDIAANVTAAGGSVSAGQTLEIGGTETTLAVPHVGRHHATGDTVVAAGVTISTAGLWTNLLADPDITFTQAFINGGAVSLASVNDLVLNTGSVIDTSSGGVIGITGTVKGGSGGAITLGAGDIALAAATDSEVAPNAAGDLLLDGTLDAVGATEGGALTLGAPAFLITDNPPAKSKKGVVVLAPSFFAQGFSAYNLDSTGDIKVAGGTVVNVTEPTYQTSSADFALPTGTPASLALQAALDPLYAPNSTYTAITQRPGAGFSADIVSPSTAGTPSVINDTALTIDNNAAINVDPGQSIDLAATGQITIDGRLRAPGGTISVVSSFNTKAALPDGPGTVSIWLGNRARLNADAEAVSFENDKGSEISLAPAGGTITLGSNSATASIIIHAGAIVEASGSAATDIASASALDTDETAEPAGTPIAVQGAGGAISLASDEGIYNDGTLLAAAGGPDAAGGSLSMTLEADNVLTSSGVEATPRLFMITQEDSSPELPADLQIGASNGLTIGTASISQEQIKRGGFGSVTLFTRDAFLFKNNVTLRTSQSITLEQGVIADTSRHGSVTLEAPYVTLSGQTPDQFNGTALFAAISLTDFSTQKANGDFTVNAGLIDINNQVRFGGVIPADGGTPATDFAGFGTVNLNSSGDLQFLQPHDVTGSAAVNTNLVTTANLNLTAREIYAMGSQSASTSGAGATLTQALVVAGYDPTATGGNGPFRATAVLNIDITAGTTALAPDTLGGTLTFEAPTINQAGVLWQPLGTIVLGVVSTGNAITNFNLNGDPKTAVNFLPGSITSVSADGLNIPVGGTTDGVNYDVDGALLSTASSSTGLDTVTNGFDPGQITIAAQNTDIESGAKIDLGGGGNLTGAGFISGEGGSVDVLTSPLLSVTASGVSQPTLAADPVYAIVAGAQPTDAVAYTETGAASSTPALGEQIVVPAGVPGLPAGRYTLLPAAYALEPGGYRVEFDGAASLAAASVTALPDGSYAVAGHTAIAGTHIYGTLASDFTITPAATVVNYAQYDQESYSAYLVANAATLGALRPQLPIDGGTLALNVPISSNVTLTDDGAVSFASADGGVGGTLVISGANTSSLEPDLDIYGAAPTADLPRGTVSLSAAAIDAFDPFTLEIGVAGAGGGSKLDGVTLEKGATLKAARVVFTTLSDGITLKSGSTVTTIGEGTLLADSTTEGLLTNNGASVLDIGNGYLVYSTAASSNAFYGPITIEDGATIQTDGSIAFSTSAAVNIGVDASYGGKYIDLAVPIINIGDPASFSATTPPGVVLTPAALQALAMGIPADDVPPVQILDLTALDSLNLYGDTALDLTGSEVQLEINTPAIYGYGSASDVATISASTIIWNGVSTLNLDTGTYASADAGGMAAHAADIGLGTLDLNAQTLVLGYSALDKVLPNVSLTRLAAGFSTVNFNASSEITANNEGSLTVNQSPVYGQADSTGVLNLNTPLLTAADGATIAYSAGGAINVGPAAGTGAASLASEAAGGEIDLTAASIGVTGSVILPSGKLDLEATNDIDLGAASRLSLAGTTTANADETIYGFGGDLIMESADGNITQDSGSVIDVSAVNNSAGSVTATATASGAGQVALNGTLLGSGSGNLAGSDASGSIIIRAQNLGTSAPLDTNFMALNTALDAGGFFQSRSFDIEQQADLTISGGVKAHNVAVSMDNGSLTVTGLIDASGNGGGSISLAAGDDLTLASGAILDADGATLETDSSGAVIDSENAPSVSLTVSGLTPSFNELTLEQGATIDLASADGVARGDLELNAPRYQAGPSAASATDSQTITDDPIDNSSTTGNLTTGADGPANAQSDDIGITADGPLNISGASTIALNGFATYTNAPADPNAQQADSPNQNPGQIIDQSYLNLINQDSVAFMNGAMANAVLAGRIAGLTEAAYRPEFHLRPGVLIESATPDGNLSVNGDIDLATYRYSDPTGASGYGLQVNSAYGSGEPGVLQIRAGGNLNVYGSITDGFEQPVSDADTEFADGWVVFGGEPYAKNQVIPAAIGIQAGSEISDDATINFAVTITGGTFAANAVVPADVSLPLSQKVTTTLGFVATSAIMAPGGKLTLFAKGDFVPAGTVLPNGALITAGGSLPFAVTVGKVTWPADTPFTVTTTINDGSGVVLADNMTLEPGDLVPGQSTLIFQASDPGLTHKNGGDVAYVESRVVGAGASQGQLYALAQLLPAGEKSWSIGLVSGADIASASPDVTQSASALAAAAAAAQGSVGDLTLADLHYGLAGNNTVPAFSVIRTGTGSLSLISGGAFDEDSSYGVYTSGAQDTGIAADDELAQGTPDDGLVLGPNYDTAAYTALLAQYAANYPTGGGNVLVSAQGDLNGYILTGALSGNVLDSDAEGGWLWRQGGAGQSAAWWIEFGTLNLTNLGLPGNKRVAEYTGFQGIGTLGGGNLTVSAGGNATGLDLVVASNGRVDASGNLDENGGGALDVTIGGTVNAAAVTDNTQQTAVYAQDEGGLISDLRGDTGISVGSIGLIQPIYGTSVTGDPRFLSPLDSEEASLANGIDLLPGDGSVTIDARGELVINGAGNPGTVSNVPNTTPVASLGTSYGGSSDFSLWSSATAIDLFSAGGDVAPVVTQPDGANQNDDDANFYPPSLSVTSQNGNIWFGDTPVELAPAPDGQLQLLAADSIFGSGSTVSISGAALSTLATPSDPGINVTGAAIFTNFDPNSPATLINAEAPIAFGADIPTSALHAGDTQPALVYAAAGDILDIEFGQITPATATVSESVTAAKPFEIYAGRDIVESGTVFSNATQSVDEPDVFLNLSASDITTITAGRDIIESSFDIAGPGELLVQAGRDYDAFAQGVIDSIGPLFDIDPNNRDSGAGVALLAGTGAAGADYSGFAETFLNPDSTLVLTNTDGDDVASQIIQTDNATLYAWLQANAGYSGDAAGAYAYFQTLPAGRQDEFLRVLYFDLLDTSGVAFNDPTNSLGLYKTYLLGKDAIAALFPSKDASGQTITYAGDITMYGLSGVHTDFGGDIETLTPGGATTVGVEGTTPPASAGIITQGNGNIDMYALDSVELGESRVLTTFGGNIVIWSAQGDINAGRGSKTTIDYTPLQRIYDNYGDVFLSPSVPSSGAGIATLNPIPSVEPGNIDLVAPLGTVDAGEAGIRGSGNLNIAALHVLNAANIQVQGSSAGVPTAVSPDVGALTSTSNAAGAAAQAAEGTTAKSQAEQLPSIWIVEILSYGGSGGSAPAATPEQAHKKKKPVPAPI